MALWGSGVRIPSAPVFARVGEESEDCRAVTLVKADIFSPCSVDPSSYDSASQLQEWQGSASIPKSDSEHQIVCHRIQFDRAVRNVELAKIRVSDLVFEHRSPMPGKIDIHTYQSLHSGTMELIFLVKFSSHL